MTDIEDQVRVALDQKASAVATDPHAWDELQRRIGTRRGRSPWWPAIGAAALAAVVIVAIVIGIGRFGSDAPDQTPPAQGSATPSPAPTPPCGSGPAPTWRLELPGFGSSAVALTIVRGKEGQSDKLCLDASPGGAGKVAVASTTAPLQAAIIQFGPNPGGYFGGSWLIGSVDDKQVSDVRVIDPSNGKSATIGISSLGSYRVFVQATLAAKAPLVQAINKAGTVLHQQTPPTIFVPYGN